MDLLSIIIIKAIIIIIMFIIYSSKHWLKLRHIKSQRERVKMND